MRKRKGWSSRSHSTPVTRKGSRPLLEVILVPVLVLVVPPRLVAFAVQVTQDAFGGFGRSRVVLRRLLGTESCRLHRSDVQVVRLLQLEAHIPEEENEALLDGGRGRSTRHLLHREGESDEVDVLEHLKSLDLGESVRLHA